MQDSHRALLWRKRLRVGKSRRFRSGDRLRSCLQIVASPLTPIDVITAVEAAFAPYSRGEGVVPPRGGLLFEEPPGDCYIKVYGYLKSDDTFTP